MRFSSPIARVAALLLVSASLPAQEARTARLEGRVHDSLTTAPLAGAVITVTQPATGLYLTARTDAAGRYQVDSVPAGRVSIGVVTGFLDSLEVQLPPRDLQVAAGERVVIDFATPSRATLFAAACPGLPVAKGRGAIVGHILDADRESPLANATVVVSWSDIGLDLRSLKATSDTRAVEIKADAQGMYRVCNLPTDTYVAMQIQHGGKASTAVQATIRENAGVMVQHLSMSASSAREIAAAEADSASARDTVTRQLRGTASVTGRVRDVTGATVAGVQVRVLEGASVTRSDADGRFTLEGLPAGTQLLEARRVGFLLVQRPVELRSGRTVEEDVLLAKIVSLDSVRIVAQRSRYQEFERRAGTSTAAAALLTDTKLAQFNLTQTSDLFKGRVLGFDLAGSGVDTKVRSMRGVGSLRGDCYANVVIDGMQRQDINLISPRDIGAIEVYRGAAGAPPEYDAMCGLILIWTKR